MRCTAARFSLTAKRPRGLPMCRCPAAWPRAPSQHDQGTRPRPPLSTWTCRKC